MSQSELQQIQVKRTLVALGTQPNGEQNQQQIQLAAEEARRDFEALKNELVSPERISSLTPLYRLGENLVDAETQTLNWPEALSTEEYAATASKLDSLIQNRKLNSAKAVKSFLNQLRALNYEINLAAAAGKLELGQYIESRVFLTGLANEIRSVDEPK